MFNIARDILSLTDFKRRSAELLKHMQKERRPMVLTVNGRAALVVQTAEDYQALLDEVDRTRSLAAIRQGLESVEANRGKPASEVFAAMEEKYPYLRRK